MTDPHLVPSGQGLKHVTSGIQKSEILYAVCMQQDHWLYEDTFKDAHALFAVVFFGYDSPPPFLLNDTDWRGGGANEPLAMIDYRST